MEVSPIYTDAFQNDAPANDRGWKSEARLREHAEGGINIIIH